MRRKILIVEDDIGMRQAVCATLSAAGFVCEEAENGRVALQKMCEATAQKTPFDLVLLDIVLPEVDGWQFLHAVRANPLWAETRVVIMTGRATAAQDVARATSLDCVHLEKRAGFLETLTGLLRRLAMASTH